MRKPKNTESAPAPKEAPSETRPFLLRSIYLREGRQWMSDKFDPVLPGQPVFGQFRSSGNIVEVQEAIENTPDAKPVRSCRITTNFEFRYMDTPIDDQQKEVEEGSSDHMVAEVSARFTVDYLIGTPEIPSQEVLNQWSQTSALYHCWPYWREFCHATLIRMNLPITMMPMLEINPNKD